MKCGFFIKYKFLGIVQSVLKCLADMTRTAKFIAALAAAYLIGVMTPYFAHYALALAARSFVGEEELSRTASPDGTLDAVVMEDHPGAWGTISYALFIVRKGARADTLLGDPPIVESSEGNALKPVGIGPISCPWTRETLMSNSLAIFGIRSIWLTTTLN